MIKLEQPDMLKDGYGNYTPGFSMQGEDFARLIRTLISNSNEMKTYIENQCDPTISIHPDIDMSNFADAGIAFIRDAMKHYDKPTASNKDYKLAQSLSYILAKLGVKE